MCYSPDGSRQSVLVTSSSDTTDGPQASPLIPPKPPPVLYIVEAQFDCKPDNKDELAFQEGDKIAVIKVHSADWLVSRLCIIWNYLQVLLFIVATCRKCFNILGHCVVMFICSYITV